MLAGACHRHVEFTVDECSVFFKYVVGQKVQLTSLLHCKSVDYVVALAALKAFHGVDCYGVQRRDAVSVNCVSYGCNLVAVRHNDSYRRTVVEAVCLPADSIHHSGYHVGLHLIGLC